MTKIEEYYCDVSGKEVKDKANITSVHVEVLGEEACVYDGHVVTDEVSTDTQKLMGINNMVQDFIYITVDKNNNLSHVFSRECDTIASSGIENEIVQEFENVAINVMEET